MAEIKLDGLEQWAVEWDDAHFSSLEYERNEITHRPMKYVTAGILVKDDEAGITLANDVCETGTFRGTNFIPAKMVIRKWKIGVLTPKRTRKKLVTQEDGQ